MSKKKLIFFVITLILLFLLFLFLKKNYSSHNKKTTNENLNQDQLSIKTLTQKNSYQNYQVFFNYQIKKLNNNQFEIIFEIKSNKKIDIDAADFYLNLSNIKIEKIEKGNAFPSYPLIKKTDNYLKITATALIKENKIIYGHVNKIFIKLIVKKNNPQETNYLTLNPQETDVFLKGKSIYDQSKKPLIIKLP